MIRWGWEPLEPGLPTPAVSDAYTWVDLEHPVPLKTSRLADVGPFTVSGELQHLASPAVGGYCPQCVNRFSLPLEAVIRADGRVSCPHCGLSEEPTRAGLAQLARHWAYYRQTGQVLPAELLDVIAAAEAAQESGGQR